MRKRPFRFLASALLAVILASALSISAFAAVAFVDDVPEDAWYYKAVYALYNGKIVYPIEENRFEPETTTTREQFVSYLGRIAREAGKDLTVDREGNALSNDLLDDSVSPWAEGCVRWAVGNKLLFGKEDGLAAGDTLTREEMAAFLVRFADYMGIELTGENEARSYSKFQDRSQVSDWAQASMQEAYYSKLIAGEIEGQNGEAVYLLHPARNVTRAEAAQVVYNYVRQAGIELESAEDPAVSE